MHIFHKWNKWKEIGTADKISNITNYITAVMVIFERECSVCGIKEFKRINRESV